MRPKKSKRRSPARFGRISQVFPDGCKGTTHKDWIWLWNQWGKQRAQRKYSRTIFSDIPGERIPHGVLPPKRKLLSPGPRRWPTPPKSSGSTWPKPRRPASPP